MSTNLGTWLGTLASTHMIEIFSDPLILGMWLGLILDFFQGGWELWEHYQRG